MTKNSTNSTTAAEILRALPDRFIPAQATKTDAVIGISLTGEDGGEWQIAVHDRTCTVQPEAPDKPDAALKIGADDFVPLILGTLDPMTAIMRGKLRISGDTALLLALDRWFKK